MKERRERKKNASFFSVALSTNCYLAYVRLDADENDDATFSVMPMHEWEHKQLYNRKKHVNGFKLDAKTTFTVIIRLCVYALID